MSLEISKAHSLMEEALNFRGMRQDMIASNIANADTPFYKPRDVRFESTLAQKQKEIMGENSQTLRMAKTDGEHLDALPDLSSATASLFYRDGHMAKNDGNSVDIDVETTEMSKNSTMYNAVIAAMKKEKMMYEAVVDASAKLS